jgi:kynurenine formamidase
MTPELVGLVQTGRVYSLAVEYTRGMLAPRPMTSYTLSPLLQHTQLQPDIFPASAAAEVISMSVHVGTHIDGLSHIGEIENGSVQLNGGEHLDAAHMPPIVTRGVLLDVARYKGVAVLPEAYSISADDVRDTLAAQGSEVRSGTAVLVRTGYSRHLLNGNPVYRDAIPGLSLDAARVLRAYGMILVGADTMTVEVLPPSDHSVHRYLIVHHGVPLLENLYLEELAAQSCHEFVLIAAPLRLTGASGSWVHPIAIA